MERRRKISESRKGIHHTEETKRRISENNVMPKIAAAYKKYKANGGSLKWHDFLKEYSKTNK